MQAIKRTRIVKNGQVLIENLPEDFEEKKVEIIIFSNYKKMKN